MANGYGLRKGIEYLENTYETNNVEVVASEEGYDEICIYLSEFPDQDFTDADIAMMNMYGFTHSTDHGYSHFSFVVG